MKRVIDMYDVIDSGYAKNKSVLEDIRAKEKTKGHTVVRTGTDTKGLIMYLVLKKKNLIKR